MLIYNQTLPMITKMSRMEGTYQEEKVPKFDMNITLMLALAARL